MLQGVISQSGWNALVAILLGPLARFAEIETTEDNIVIKSRAEIMPHLQKVLSSPHHFMENLPYRVLSHSTPIPDPYENTKDALYPAPADTVSTGLSLFKTFFRQSLPGVHFEVDKLFDAKKGAVSKERILYSIPTQQKEVMSIWENYIKILKEGFHHSTHSQLRALWKNHFQRPPLAEDSHVCKEKWAQGLISKCLGIKENPNTQEMSFFFDFGLLYRITFAPQIRMLSSKNKEIIFVNKQHLKDYVEHLAPNNILMRLYRAGENSNKFIVKPLFFPIKSVSTSPLHYTIIIQAPKSTSLPEYYEENIMSLIEKLKSHDKRATIRIKYCGVNQPVYESSIARTNDIKHFINTGIVEKETTAFHEIELEVKHLARSLLTYKKPTIFFFSSGKLEEEKFLGWSYYFDKMDNALSAFAENKLPYPKIFTLEENNSNYEYIAIWSKITHGRFMHLNKREDFQDIEQYLPSIIYDEEHLFVEGKTSTSVKTIDALPVTRDGELHFSPQGSFEVTENEDFSLRVEHNLISFKVSDITKVPLATLADAEDEIIDSIYKEFDDFIFPRENPGQVFSNIVQKAKAIWKKHGLNQNLIFMNENILKLLGNFCEIIDFAKVDLGSLSTDFFLDKFPKPIPNAAPLLRSLFSQAQYQNYFSGLWEGDVKKVDRRRFCEAYSPKLEYCERDLSLAQDCTYDYKAESYHLTSLAEKESASVKPMSSSGNTLYNPIGELIKGIGSFFVNLFVSFRTVPVSPAVVAINNIPLSSNSITTDCVLNVTQSEEGFVPSLICRSPFFEAEVFHKHVSRNEALATQSASVKEDEFDLSACKPLEYGGKPALACEGNKTSVIVKPNLPAKLFESWNGNLMWLLLFQGLFQRKNSSEPIKEPGTVYVRKESFYKQAKQLHLLLDKAKVKVNAMEEGFLKNETLKSIDSFAAELSQMQKQIKNEGVFRNNLATLRENIKHLAHYPFAKPGATLVPLYHQSALRGQNTTRYGAELVEVSPAALLPSTTHAVQLR